MASEEIINNPWEKGSLIKESVGSIYRNLWIETSVGKSMHRAGRKEGWRYYMDPLGDQWNHYWMFRAWPPSPASNLLPENGVGSFMVGWLVGLVWSWISSTQRFHVDEGHEDGPICRFHKWFTPIPHKDTPKSTHQSIHVFPLRSAQFLTFISF